MFEQTFKNIDDVLWKEAGCTTELDYTEQSSWMLFPKYLDDLEQGRTMEAELVGKTYTFIIDEPHRWSAWAAPKLDGSAEQVVFISSYQVLLTHIFYQACFEAQSIVKSLKKWPLAQP